MNLIVDDFQQAGLALAAYANLATGVPDISALQDQGRGMSFAQAAQFAKDWVVVAQYNHISDPYPIYDAITGDLVRYDTTTNGLSATVFEEVSTHKRYLAIRGTDDLYDMATDIVSVSLLGTTKFQGQYQSLKAKVQEWLANGTLPATFTVTGHSLGGFLATGLAIDFGANVEHAYLYNAPGVDGLAATQAVANLLKALHIDERLIETGKFSNLKAAAGPSPIAGLGLPISPVIPVEIENQFLSDVSSPPAARNHSQQVLTDGLAVYALYAALAPSLALDQIGSILKSATNQNKLTLESSLDALRVTLLGKNTVQTPEGDRDKLYSNLYALQSSPEYRALAGSATLRVLTASDAGSLSSLAKNDFGALVSLNYLLPIAIEGSSGVLGTVHTTLYAQWQADQALTAEQRAKGEGNYTESWLADRAKFLAWMIQANTLDKTAVSDGGNEQWAAEDKTLKGASEFLPYSLDINNGLFGITGDARKMIFGKETDDSNLNGGDKNDRIYGGGGNDSLDGGQDDDYLEGNAGNDTLKGGDGRDTLLGGAGDDALNGGKGSDTLLGGLGFDTYTVGGGNGWDWLEDKDGIGKILYADSQGGADIPLKGGTAVTGTDNVWKQESNGKTFWYILTDWTENGETFKRLSIEGPDGGVFIKAWSAGQLGINLPGAPVENPAPTVLAGTSGTDKIHAQHDEAVITGNGGADLLQAGNVSTALYADDVIPNLSQYVANTAQLTGGGSLDVGVLQSGSVLMGSGYSDTVVGGSGNDALFGGIGRDVLIGGGGADLILGDGLYSPELTPGEGAYVGWKLSNTPGKFAIVGSGMTDALYQYSDPGDAADIIHGGGGNDMAWGGLGDDLLYGEGGDDWLVGASGSDLIDGGDGNDLLAGDADTFEGPAGNDTLIGGKGNDYLYGYTGNDRLEGGDDNDMLVGDMPAGLGLGVDGSLDGNDFLDGEGGNDTLFGGGNDDELHGGTGADWLCGDGSEITGPYMGKDTLYGDDGNDTLIGDGNDDRLFGGNDDDQLFGDNSTTPLANQGNDYLDGGNGNDYLRGYGGNDTLLGGVGTDNLLGDAGNDQLDGGDGNDTLYGGDDSDLLAGGSGDDALYGEQGNDTLGGGAGADTLRGGAGNDTYVGLNAGDVVLDREGNNIFRLDSSALSIRLDSSGSGVEIVTSSGIVRLADALFGSEGTVIDQDGKTLDLHAWISSSVSKSITLTMDAGGGSAYGASGADLLDGGRGADNLSGEAGDDWIRAAQGTDVLTGGTGRDHLFGGDGSDRYVYARGDGSDIIGESSQTGSADIDTLWFGPGIQPGDVELLSNGNDLVVMIDHGQGQININNYFAQYQGEGDHAIEQFVFDNGLGITWSKADILSKVSIGALNAMVGTAGNDTFVVDNVGDTVSEAAGGGTDTIVTPFDIKYLPQNVENVTLTGNVDALINGNALANVLRGNSGNNEFYGQGVGSSPGQKDTLIGGAGDDIYHGALSDIAVVELAGEGTDLIVADYDFSVPTYQLPDNVENINLRMVAFPNTPQTLVRGNADANLIQVTNATQYYGPLHTIDGGAGADTMMGYGDSFEFVVDDPGDVVIAADYAETYSQSHTVTNRDRVLSSVNFTLGKDLDNLTLTGTANLKGDGNELDNILLGNSSDNQLSAESGNDTLRGGNGNDTLYGGAGNDLFEDGFGVSYGNDYLSGGAGNDTYVFDTYASTSTGQDVIDDADPLTGGIDTIRFNNTAGNLQMIRAGDDLSIKWSYGWSNQSSVVVKSFFNQIDGLDHRIERFEFSDGSVLTGDQVSDIATQNALPNPIAGTTGDDSNLQGTWRNDVIVANAGNDWLFGNDGNDTLDGGAGTDYLNGGDGNDTYLFGNGDGVDSVNLNSSYGVDLLRFKSGIQPEQVAVRYRINNDRAELVLSLNNGTDQIIISGSSGYDPALMPQIQFSDSSIIWGAADIAAKALVWTDGSDTIGGTKGNDSLSGGLGNDTLSGWQGNDTLDGGQGADSLIGGIGDDVYLVDNIGDVITENASEGIDTVQSSITYSLGAELENLVLTGSSAINGTGNTLNNVITGNGAANTLSGGTGADTMIGGAGDDTYVVDNIGDVIAENAGEGTDLVQSSVTYTLSANVEKLTLTGTTAINGTGNTLDNLLTGNSAANTLTGGAGNDTLNGGAGNDTMVGGLGDDTYVVDSTSDVITEATNEGTDLVQSSVTYTLASNVENLTLTGTTAINGTGNTLNNVLAGNSAANTLTGGAGNDSLDGGAGNDTMVGGLGDDIYVVDSASDVVTENASEGVDTVRSSVTLTLANNVENLVLTGTSAINGTGNTLNNIITGNSAANTLSGGTGADTMIGGAGDDTYVVDNTGDVVTENASEGIDLVQSSVTYTLAANLENLTLTGTTAINGTGNTQDNILTGNTVANTLTGGAGNDTLNGGTGADTMVGGTGNDTYVVDNTSDVVTELAGEGTDLVQSSVTYTLSSNVENLTLTGTSAINGTGNALDNILIGNSANNTLTGGDGNDTIDGGTGNDTMVGGLGDDTYVVNVSTDVVTEAASAGNDTIQSAVTLTLTTNVENLVLTGTTAINGTGNTLNNLLRGNSAINTLNGGTGNDILEGGDGNDILTDTSGTALFNGGLGADSITGGASAEIFLGGLGNDTYTTAGGNDIILFNKGDGQDTFATGGTGSDTLSLGGSGLTYADLVFTKSTNDLVLKVGTTDQITFKDWYAATPSKPVTRLQVMAEAMAGFVQGGSNPLLDQKVENFNFTSLVGAFDAARAANGSLTSWALTNALTNFQLAGSDTAAMGGDLAYQYGKNGTLAGIGVTPALSTLSDANLGTNPQALNSLASLQTGTVRLS